jgi:hypothetical protein
MFISLRRTVDPVKGNAASATQSCAPGASGSQTCRTIQPRAIGFVETMDVPKPAHAPDL